MSIYGRTKAALTRPLVLALCLTAAPEICPGAIPSVRNPRGDGAAGELSPKEWRRFSTEGRYEFAVDTEAFHSPPSSARIRGLTSSGRACVSSTTDAFAPVPYYRFTVWYRTENACRLRGFVRFIDAVKPNPQGNGFFMHTFAMEGTPGEWREFRSAFALPEERRAAHPSIKALVVLYGDPSGAVWFDDMDFGEGEAPPPPPPNPLDKPITALKNLYLDTCLAESGRARAVIAVGTAGKDRALAVRIQQKIRECTAAVLPIRSDLTPSAALKTTHVIALGNMATNPFIEALYRRYCTFLDLYYPGRGGYVVRSVHNPYGTGKNVLLLGGSDLPGVARAVDAFLGKLAPADPLKIGWTMEIELGEGLVPPGPGKPVVAWDNLRSTPLFGWNPITIDLTLYFMTGDPAYIDDARLLLFPKGEPDRRLFDGDRMFEDLKHPLATVYHYRGHIGALMWDLVEESPVFTDAERLHVTNEYLAQQKHLNVAGCKRFASNGALPDRHAIYEIMNVATGSRYFAHSYPDPVWDDRVALCKSAFALSLQTPASSTPRIQTGTVIWPILDFALVFGMDKYFEPDGVFAQRMEKWLFLGDEASRRTWNYVTLQAAAHTLKDGRFLSLHPLSEGDMTTFRIGQSYLSGVVPTPVTGTTGLRAFKMWAPNHRRLGMNVSLDEAIEFLVFRSSMAPDRQNVFLYGYYEGSKSPPRANAILSYQNHGVRLLRPGANSGVTVCKSGMRESGPSNGAALKCLEEIGRLAYARTDVPDHDFCTWDRSLFILKGQCLAVFDRVVTREPGDYEVSVRWYPGSSPKPSPDGLRWSTGGRRCAVLTADGFPTEQIAGSTNFVYRGEMSKGGSRLFRSLLTTVSEAAPIPAIVPLGPSAAVLRAGELAAIGTGELIEGDLTVAAEAFMIAPDSWALVRGTHLSVCGLEFRADEPVSLSWDLRGGAIVVRAYEKNVSLRLPGPETKTVSCPAGQEVRMELMLPDVTDAIARVTRFLEAALALPPEKSTSATTDERGISARAPALGLRWRRDCEHPITALHVYGEAEDKDSGILVGVGNGALLLRADGSERWRLATDGPVYTVASGVEKGSRVFLVGSDDEHVYALDEAGRRLWTYKARVSEWMAHHHHYWTMNGKAKVRRILPADVDDDGELDIFIGTGGSAVERLDAAGKARWLFTFKYGTPMSLVLADVRESHPGMELVAGTFNCSYNCIVRLIDPATGKELPGAFSSRYPANTKGPRKRAPSSFGQGNVFASLHQLNDGKLGLLRAVCSGNWNNLVMNDVRTGGCLWGRDFGPGGSGSYLRQFIAGIAIPAPPPDAAGSVCRDVVAGLQSGWMCAFAGADGRLIWSRKMSAPVSAVAGAGDGALASTVLVGCEKGEISQLDRQGRATHAGRVAGRPQIAAVLPGEHPVWIVGTRTGQLVALSPDLPDQDFPRIVSRLPFLTTVTSGAGGASAPLQTVGTRGRGFVGAALGVSNEWTLGFPAGARVELRSAGLFGISHPTIPSGAEIRILYPEQAKITARGNQLHVVSGQKGILLVRIDLAASAGHHQRNIVIERNRWANMRTNGPVAKTLFSGRMAFFLAEKMGDWIDFDLAIPEDGAYDLSACFCNHRDRATFDVGVDGKILKQGLDLYSPRVEWTKPILLGRRQLTRGNHVLRFTVVGKAEKSSRYLFGLESVALIPAGDQGKVRVTSRPSGLRADWQEGSFSCAALFRPPGTRTPIGIGDISVDADACAVIRKQDTIVYWEMLGGVALRVNGRSLAELDAPRSVCGGESP